LFFSVVSFIFFFLASFASAPKAENNTITFLPLLSIAFLLTIPFLFLNLFHLFVCLFFLTHYNCRFCAIIL
jgi:hypothetical protein